MPTIGIPKESNSKETRVAATPDSVRKLTSLKGVEVMIESGLGARLKVSDQEYEKAGAAICSRKKIFVSDFIFQISPMSLDRLSDYKKGGVYIGCLDPYNRRDLIQSCVSYSIDAVSMEMMPRTTRAQKMDILSLIQIIKTI